MKIGNVLAWVIVLAVAYVAWSWWMGQDGRAAA